ncbi:MAG TPA: aspartate kinase [Candidatus Spyradenecus faecavium]|uniref:Aspartokinase n=1 Tax=Candidatus Spyradenecus faecavium TaxID=2840947 RepID=A0A9D1NMN2_9BACT|nr:aspartate kinase [Candidatus Spyradenecus faecavium]
MKVCKFGGSSVADATQVAKIRDIIASDPTRRIVVVSAPGKRNKGDTKVTDLLIECAGRCLTQRDPAEVRDAIVARYDEIREGLGLDPAVMDEIRADLDARIAAYKDLEAARFMDLMKAAGEDNAAKIVAAAFRAGGLRAEYANPQEAGLLMSDDFGNAQVLPESYKRLADYLNARTESEIVVFPGFFGYTQAGDVATFPRGGSDITGSILAAAVKAKVYENFTDVDAVYPVDPRLVPEVTQGIPEMTYREMRELSYAGFGVFQDEAIIPAVKAAIPINIRNTNHPDAPGTMIVHHRRARQGSVVGIASSAGFCTLYIDKYMMNREIGFGRRLLQILEEEGISYEHMPSGIDNVSVVFREEGFTPEVEGRVRDHIMRELKPDNLQIERGTALIMIVGEGLYYTPGMAAHATLALFREGISLDMMNQGSSEISMMFGIQSSQRENAVRALYHAFFKD